MCGQIDLHRIGACRQGVVVVPAQVRTAGGGLFLWCGDDDEDTCRQGHKCDHRRCERPEEDCRAAVVTVVRGWGPTGPGGQVVVGGPTGAPGVYVSPYAPGTGYGECA